MVPIGGVVASKPKVVPAKTAMIIMEIEIIANLFLLFRGILASVELKG